MHAEPVSCSVIICAYTTERWTDLCAAVDSVRGQTRAPDELIVVTDHNDDLMARAQTAFPDCAVIASTQPRGLSGARNTGLARATGEVVAFIDDDAVAGETWLEELLAAPWDDNVLGVGGLIAPHWDAERPMWLPEEFYWVVGCSFPGVPDASTVRNLVGANMSFRRDVLLTSGGFNSRLGRTSTQALAGEETEVCIRAQRLHPGGVFITTSRARVDHRVPESRTTRAYFHERCYGEGMSKAVLSRTIGSREGLASERRYTFVTLPKAVVRNLWSGLTGDRTGYARAGAVFSGLASTAAGYVAGWFARLPRFASERRLAPTCATEEAFCIKPRVLMVTPQFSPHVGGVEMHVEKVAPLLNQHVNVTVLTTDPSRELPPTDVVAGVHVVRVPAWPRNRDYYFAPSIRRVIRAGDWDLVHVQSYHSAVAPVAMISSLRAGVPYVTTFHRGGHSSRLRNSLRSVQERLLRPLLARAQWLIAVAQFEVDHFTAVLRLPRNRFVLIPNGSDLAGLHVEDERRGPNDRPTILSVGRLERYKGHQRVIEAMPSVIAEIPESSLEVIGAGPYQLDLQQVIERLGLEDKVIIRSIPPEDRQAMAQALTWSSLVVLMSEFETHPLAIIEALELGRPALVADTSGLREIAEQGLARSVPLKISAAELASAIVDELKDPSTRPPVASGTWQECADKLLELYVDVLSSRDQALASRAS